MRRRFPRFLLTGLSLVSLLAALPLPASAAIVFDDHFDGNSGGMPEGWSLFLGSGTVVESGTVVTLDHNIIIVSDATIDPNSGTVAITWDVAGASPSIYSLALLVASASLSAAMAIGLEPSGEEFQVLVGAFIGGDWQEGGWAQALPGYMGGPVRFTLTVGPTSFSVTCEDPPISSGSIDYAEAFPDFTRADLGTVCNLLLQNDAPDEFSAPSSVDRIVVDVADVTPVESTTFGRIKALFR